MKRILFLVAVTALAFSPLTVSQAQAAGVKNHKAHHQAKHAAKHQAKHLAKHQAGHAGKHHKQARI